MFTPQIHRAQLAAALGASSDLCVFPWQDVLGARERIKLPGSRSDSNWAYRLSSGTEALLLDEKTRSAASALAELTTQAHRAPG
ncbi:MAG: 4-alpha-glucanotransferase [Myxococcaceae bacterium]